MNNFSQFSFLKTIWTKEVKYLSSFKEPSFLRDLTLFPSSQLHTYSFSCFWDYSHYNLSIYFTNFGARFRDLTWHADACKLSNTIKAGGIILARHGEAFIDVCLTAWTCITTSTLALEGALRVHTFAKMFTWISSCR